MSANTSATRTESIVARLRTGSSECVKNVAEEAANEIEQLLRERDAARKMALEQFLGRFTSTLKSDLPEDVLCSNLCKLLGWEPIKEGA